MRLLARLKSSTGLVVAALCSITVAFYYGLWWPGLVLIHRDALRFYLPIKQHLIERLSAGELPQWFPYDALGRPFIGIAASGVFHPFTALYFFFSFHDAYRVSALISCLLAALGGFALGRTLNYSRAGALVAGLSFALSGYVASLTFNIVYLYSIAVLPFFCAALETALARRRTWVIAPAIVWATVFLNGDVQTGYYYGFIALLWAGTRATCSYRESALRLVLAGALAVLLAGVQLGPAGAVFAGSDRSRSETIHDEAVYWSTHPLRLATMVAAPLAAEADPVVVGRFFFGNPEYGMWADSLYLGIPAMGLALLGAWHRRDLRVLALLGSLALLLALGRYGGLYEIFYTAVPLWSAFRFPEKLMGIVSFAIAMLAGAGLDAVRARKGALAPWVAAAVLCTGAGIGLRTEAVGVWVAASFGAPEALARMVTNSAGLACFYGAVAALGVWLILAGARRGYLRETLALGALTAIVALDLARVNLAAYRTAPAEAATFVPPLARAIAAREGTLAPGRFRMLSLRDTHYLAPEPVHRLFGHDWETVERRQALDVAYNSQFHLESLFDYLPGRNVTLKAMMPSLVRIDVAARYNVVYYIAHRTLFTDPIFARAIVAQLPDYDLTLVRNPLPAKPRAYLSHRPERAASPVDPAVLLARPDFLNGDVDVIETTDAALPGPALSGSAVIERYTPEEVRVRVETLQPAVLILLDVFDQGWTATLENGVKVPILRANALVRAVVVPAGTHVVTFSYQTPLLKAGATASLVGCLLCLGLITHARWRHRHPAGPRQ
jgi:membrane protein YfhO